jgi:hypothetical protein
MLAQEIKYCGGVAIFVKACFGHPSPSKRQKLNATANAFGAPIRAMRNDGDEMLELL